MVHTWQNFFNDHEWIALQYDKLSNICWEQDLPIYRDLAAEGVAAAPWISRYTISLFKCLYV